MGEKRILRRSVHTELSLTMPRPRLRGLSHRIAAVVAVPAAAAAVAIAPSGRPRAAVAAFAVGIAVMFTLSATYHLRAWGAAMRERLLRLDHTGIYLAIAGTGIALGMLGFDGWPQRVVLASVTVGTALGIVAEWLPFASPRGFNHTVYLTIGWIPIALVPWLWLESGTWVVALLLAGGAMYSVGAIVVGVRRPRLSPVWFGYHELFHVLVIGAVAVHAVMIALLVGRSA